MSRLSKEGIERLGEIAGRHGVSLDAVEHMLLAVMAGGGTQAQFNHPDLGGMGQWSQGGMTMVGDMFNNALKARVDALATELSALAREDGLLLPARASSQSQSQSQGGGAPSIMLDGADGGGSSLFVPGAFRPSRWWPAALGQPASTGAQNDLRYAFFPDSRRLAIDIAGRVTVYDTGDHQIGGFSQQQGGGQSITFTSQHGLVRVADLDVVDPAAAAPPAAEQSGHPPAADRPAPPAPRAADDDIFEKIERLAALHAKGILTDKEFETKKADLLDRL
jgi:hypothetical protein